MFATTIAIASIFGFIVLGHRLRRGGGLGLDFWRLNCVRRQRMRAGTGNPFLSYGDIYKDPHGGQKNKSNS